MVERFVRSGTQYLRCGYTTGTCAALAALGAARLLLTGTAPERVSLLTPKGWEVETPILDPVLEQGVARCAVEKDSGDDPDVTQGCLVAAAVERRPQGILIDGGEGVGRVTRPGLDQPVGSAAINSGPRRMIAQALTDLREELGYSGGFSVVISVPGGEELAKKTFNPRLGVLGGISILGTTGVVEPMSTAALVDTMELEVRQAAQTGRRLLLVPGNYGAEYLRETGLDRLGVPVVKCGNFIGEALDAATAQGFTQILLVGHLGKLVKLAGGIMNTHSAQADCRTELITAHAAISGGDRALCQSLMTCPSTDACLDLLKQAGLLEPVMESLLTAIQDRLDRRCGDRAGAILFSKIYGTLGRTARGTIFIKEWER